MFCPNCGKQIEDNSAVCPECGASIAPAPKTVAPPPAPAPKKRSETNPISAVGFVFSIISFVFGFIIVTASFVQKRGVTYAEFISVLPALVGLGIGVYKLVDKKSDRKAVMMALISIGICLFILLYVFIGYMVVICPAKAK